jgi:hypothetical protein
MLSHSISNMKIYNSTTTYEFIGIMLFMFVFAALFYFLHAWSEEGGNLDESFVTTIAPDHSAPKDEETMASITFADNRSLCAEKKKRQMLSNLFKMS